MERALAEAAAGVARWAVPGLVAIIVGLGLWSGVPVYEVFVKGARSGLAVGLRLVPYMVAMLTATEVFRASGAMDSFSVLVGPVARWLGLPAQVLPLALIRPLSGSAAMGLLAFLLEAYGPDSAEGRLASVMQGSTETTLYVITVYLGSVGIRDPRWSLATGLLADAAGFCAAALFTRLLLPGPFP